MLNLVIGFVAIAFALYSSRIAVNGLIQWRQGQRGFWQSTAILVAAAGIAVWVSVLHDVTASVQ